MKIELIKTCDACPEQYAAFDENGEQVGYLRLRHGTFRVDVPDTGGKTVYSAAPQGDGMFEDDERAYFLGKAIESIKEELGGVTRSSQAMDKVSGMVCYVKDPLQTAKFYRQLGFVIDREEPNHVSVVLKSFWIDFHPQDKEDKPDFQREATLGPKGAGLFLYISIDDVDRFYKEVKDKGLSPSNEPRDWPWGNREFVIRDPDGYKLVFFHVLQK